MERSTPVRKRHTSTADLLTWSENPFPDSSDAGSGTTRPIRDVQPSDGIRKIVFGGQVSDEEVEILLKRKPCSDHKKKEMTGSGIFVGEGEDNDPDQESQGEGSTPNKTGLRMYQQAISGMSQISFGGGGDDEESTSVSPKKPITLTVAAKQRELSGTLESDELKKPAVLSDAKCKELSGHDIFAPPLEIKPRQLKKDLQSSITNFGEEEPIVLKTAKKIPDQKFAHLSGKNIFKEEEEQETPKSASLSSAKLKEISGNDIFADGKVESRDYLGGVRKPPGGESSIALV